MAAGADLSRVFRADIIDADGFDLPLSLPKDTAALAQAITDVDAAIVIFDPLLSRLDSRLDSHKDADMRRALEPLSAMADTAKVTVSGSFTSTSPRLGCADAVDGVAGVYRGGAERVVRGRRS